MTEDHAFMIALAEERAALAADLERAPTEDGITDALERLADLADLEMRVQDYPRSVC